MKSATRFMAYWRIAGSLLSDFPRVVDLSEVPGFYLIWPLAETRFTGRPWLGRAARLPAPERRSPGQ